MRQLILAAILGVGTPALGQAVYQPIVYDTMPAPGLNLYKFDLTTAITGVLGGAPKPQLLSDGNVVFRSDVRQFVGASFHPTTQWRWTQSGITMLSVEAGGFAQSWPSALGGVMQRCYIVNGTARQSNDIAFYDMTDGAWVNVLGMGAPDITLDGVTVTLSDFSDSETLYSGGVFAAKGGVSIGGQNKSVLMAGAGTAYHAMVQSGRQAVGLPDGVTEWPIGSTSVEPGHARLNASRQFVVRVGLSGTGVTSLNNRAIYAGTLGGPSRLLLRTGDPVPTLPGTTIRMIGCPSINAAGQIALTARYNDGSGTEQLAVLLDHGNGPFIAAKSGDTIAWDGPAGTTMTLSPAGWVQTNDMPAALVMHDGSALFLRHTNRGQAVIRADATGATALMYQGQIVPHTGGRVSIQSTFPGSENRILGLGCAPDGRVFVTIVTNGAADPRVAAPGPPPSPMWSVLQWKAGTGTRLVVGNGQLIEMGPAATHRYFVAAQILAESNGEDGVANGYGTPGKLAVVVDHHSTNAGGGAIAVANQALLLVDLDRYACNVADIASQGAIETPDGTLDNNDFIVLLNRFFNNDLRADYGTQGGLVGLDSLLDNNDFVAFVDLFFRGCE